MSNRHLLHRIPRFVRTHQLAILPKPRPGETEEAVKGDYSRRPTETDDPGEAEVVMSYDLATELHRPILDIDFPVRVIGSSTPGHHHLYIDKPMSWPEYEQLLDALEYAGLIEPGYGAASRARGYTCVRLPWVKKGDTPKQEPEQAPPTTDDDLLNL